MECLLMPPKDCKKKIKSKEDCEDEALALAEAINKITESADYKSLLDAFETNDKDAMRLILTGMGVRYRIIKKILDESNMWSDHSVAFKWI